MPDDSLEIAQKLETLRKLRVVKARGNLIDYALLMLDSYHPEPFHYLIADRLEAAERGDIPRLMIFMPPRHGKTELSSRLFPSWFLGRNAQKEVIASTYSAELAASFGKDARNYVKSAEFKEVFPQASLSQDASARTDWEVYHQVNNRTRRSKYFGTSVGGSATGKGAHVFIIDDPVKDRAEANSKTIRDRIWDWYTAVAYTRLEERRSAVVLIMTRWHEDDLAGRLLAKEMETALAPDSDSDRFNENWEVLSLPAIAEKDEKFQIFNPDYQERLGSEFFSRKKGAPLYPRKFPLDRYLSIRAVDEPDFVALYQQRPSIEEGEIFKEQWWTYYGDSDLPSNVVFSVQSWDTGSTRNESSDPSVGITAVFDGLNVYLTDLTRGKFTYPDLKQLILDEYKEHRPHKVVIEYKSSGIDLVEDLKQTILPVEPFHVRGDSKLARAMSVTSLIEAGRVKLPRNAPWLTDFIDELKKFPNAKHDDQVDSLSQLLRFLLNLMADAMFGEDIGNKNFFPSFRPPCNWPIVRAVNIPANGDPFSVLWLTRAHSESSIAGYNFFHNTPIVFAELYGVDPSLHPSFKGASYSVAEVQSFIRELETNFNISSDYVYYLQESEEFNSISQSNLTEMTKTGDVVIPVPPDHRLSVPFLKQQLRDAAKPLIITSNCKNLWRVLPFVKRDLTGAGVFARSQELSLVDCLLTGVSPMMRGEFVIEKTTKQKISQEQLDQLRYDSIFDSTSFEGVTPSHLRPSDGYDD